MTDIIFPLQEEALRTFIPKILVVTIMKPGSAGRHGKRGGRSLKSFSVYLCVGNRWILKPGVAGYKDNSLQAAFHYQHPKLRVAPVNHVSEERSVR